MRSLNTNELRAIGGGDNDGNAGEAEGAAFYARYGTCERGAGESNYTCTKDGQITAFGNTWD